MRCDRELVTRGDRVMTTKQYELEQLDWKEMAEKWHNFVAQCTPIRYTLTDRTKESGIRWTTLPSPAPELIPAPEIFTRECVPALAE